VAGDSRAGLDASRVPVVYHSRKVARAYPTGMIPDMIEMARRRLDTLVVIIPGGTCGPRRKCQTTDVMKR